MSPPNRIGAAGNDADSKSVATTVADALMLQPTADIVAAEQADHRSYASYAAAMARGLAWVTGPAWCQMIDEQAAAW